VRIKGTSLASFLAFLEAEFGPGKTRDFTTALEPALRKRCEGVILASAFYPIEDLISLATQARAHFGGDATFFERSGEFYASFGLAGVYQALLSRRTPLDFLRAVERSMGQFVDEARVAVENELDGSVSVKLTGFPVSEIVCARHKGFLTKGLELAGAVGLTVREVRCTRTGEPCCEWELTWNATASPRPQSLTTGIKRPVGI
jgi:hypothetical protein